MNFSLDIHSVRKLLTSIRARIAPKHKCTAWPKTRSLLDSTLDVGAEHILTVVGRYIR